MRRLYSRCQSRLPQVLAALTGARPDATIAAIHHNERTIMRKGKRVASPLQSANSARPLKPPKPTLNLETCRPAKPLHAARGSYRSDGVDVESWYGYDTKAGASFEILVDPAMLHLRTRHEQSVKEIASMPHAAFAAHDTGRNWTAEVFGAQTLSDIDGEIDRLAKRATSGLPYGADNWEEGNIEFEGGTHACLQRQTVQTCSTTFLMGAEVIVNHWWYHPQYDEEPNIRTERYSIAAFMGGTGQVEVLESFGTRALDRMLNECLAHEPRHRIKDIRDGGWAASIKAWLKRKTS